MFGMLQDAQFWIGLLQIIGINIILSGDNAVVIALACRGLPPQYQKLGLIFGAGAAIVLRIIFVVFVVALLTIPYLKIIGSLLLFWIAIKLLLPENGEHDQVDAKSSLMGAIQTVVVADAVMSLDNVIGIAAAAKGNVVLLILGLLISMPLIIYGAALILRLLQRFPIIVDLGGALLGYVAGDIAVTDPVLADWVTANAAWLHAAAPIAGAVFVVAAGKWLARRAAKRRSAVDLAAPE